MYQIKRVKHYDKYIFSQLRVPILILSATNYHILIPMARYPNKTHSNADNLKTWYLTSLNYAWYKTAL